MSNLNFTKEQQEYIEALLASNKKLLKDNEDLLNNNAELNKRALEAEAKVESQKFEIEYLKAEVAYLQDKKYGKSKDNVDLDKYPNLFNYETFNEAEATADSSIADPEEITEQEIEVTFKVKGSRKKNLINRMKNIEVKRIVHDLKDEEKICTNCGNELVPMGSTITKKLIYIPAKIRIEEHEYKTYKCVNCSDEKANITKAKNDLAFPKSMADSTLVSHIIMEKYYKSVPLYRQEKIFEQFGIPLTRINMSNWVIESGRYIKPIFDKMHKDLLELEIILGDETPTKVIESKKETNYVWMFNSCKYDKQIYLYFAKDSREHHHLTDILKGYKCKYFQSDAYQAYEKLEGVTNVYCLAHARRKFTDILKISKNNSNYKLMNSYCATAIDYCNKLYKIEDKLKNKSIEKIYQGRQELSLPIIKEFKVWVNSVIDIFPPKSKMGEAISYLHNNFDNIMNYTLDGRLALDNNKSERMAKNYKIGKKNWLFSFSELGADTSAMIYSIIETAKANKLRIYEYLIHVFNTLAKYEEYSDELIESLLPYSPNLPKYLILEEKSS